MIATLNEAVREGDDRDVTYMKLTGVRVRNRVELRAKEYLEGGHVRGHHQVWKHVQKSA